MTLVFFTAEGSNLVTRYNLTCFLKMSLVFKFEASMTSSI